MRNLPAEKACLSLENQAVPTPNYTCFNPSTGQITRSAMASFSAFSSLSTVESKEGDAARRKILIYSNIVALEQADWQLLSGLLLPQLSSLYRSSAIFNSRYKILGLKICSYSKSFSRILIVYLAENHYLYICTRCTRKRSFPEDEAGREARNPQKSEMHRTFVL